MLSNQKIKPIREDLIHGKPIIQRWLGPIACKQSSVQSTEWPSQSFLDLTYSQACHVEHIETRTTPNISTINATREDLRDRKRIVQRRSGLIACKQCRARRCKASIGCCNTSLQRNDEEVMVAAEWVWQRLHRDIPKWHA